MEIIRRHTHFNIIETEDEEKDFQNLHGGLLRRIGLQCLQ